MVGVDEETETEKNVGEVIKKRGSWLFVNLWTAVLGSLVISQFEGTIKALPTLAVLMPIVASMGGNGGNQTLAVMVRKLALGEIDDDNWKDQMGKEIFVAVMNGLIFAVLIGLVTYLWKHDLLMSVVIGTAMIINLIVAGVSGGLIPIMLKKFNVDPAVGSSVILTTLTDVIGFFAFLGLAQMFILS
jgi:magnesium transporter